ncbi:MAG TPA: peptidoglycan-binding domain-containing protein, partial [Solimonas sp.]
MSSQKQGWILAALCALTLAGAPAFAQPPPEQATPAEDSLQGTPDLASGAKGLAVLRAQVLLDRAHFPSGEIDAEYGSNMQRAVAAWQRRHSLKATGRLDAKSWEALTRDTAPVLVSYRITEADVAGPYQAIPEDMMEKAKLPALGYVSAEEALAERFHVRPELLRLLNKDKGFNRAGEEIVVPGVSRSALPAASKVVVDRSDLSVSLIDEQGQVAAR